MEEGISIPVLARGVLVQVVMQVDSTHQGLGLMVLLAQGRKMEGGREKVAPIVAGWFLVASERAKAWAEVEY